MNQVGFSSAVLTRRYRYISTDSFQLQARPSHRLVLLYDIMATSQVIQITRLQGCINLPELEQLHMEPKLESHFGGLTSFEHFVTLAN
jgi:hypothetical protein